MKPLGIVILTAVAMLVAACETTQTTTGGNQEAQRMAELQRQRSEAQVAESDRNLWNAQRDVLTRDGNPTLRYY